MNERNHTNRSSSSGFGWLSGRINKIVSPTGALGLPPDCIGDYTRQMGRRTFGHFKIKIMNLS